MIRVAALATRQYCCSNHIRCVGTRGRVRIEFQSGGVAGKNPDVGNDIAQLRAESRTERAEDVYAPVPSCK